MYLNFADPPEWQARATSAAEAVSAVLPGDHVFVGTACATPQTLVDALERLDKPPAGVVLTHYLTERIAPSSTHYRGELAGWEVAQLVRRGEQAERGVGTKAELRGPVLGDPDSGDRLAVRSRPPGRVDTHTRRARVRRSAS